MISKTCYVPSYLYKEYNSQIVWQNKDDSQYYNLAFDWLKDRCYMLGDTCCIERPDGTISKTSNKRNAIGETMNYYSGSHQNGEQIIFLNAEVIKQYWNQPLKLDGDLLLPNGPQFVTFDKRNCLNLWQDTRLIPKKIDIKLAFPILEVIYKSLCGGNENASFDEIVYEGEQKNEFGWVIQWLANLYQCPGRKPETSLFLVGGYGTGKNTLVKLMGRLLGDTRWITDLKKEEIKRGWTGNLKDTLLVFADEFSAESRTDTYDFIKEHSSEIQISVMERNKGQHKILHTAQWIFASNNLTNPVIVKEGDRRLTFIQSKDVSESEAEMHRWKAWVSERVKSFSDENSSAYDPNILEAFAKYMSEVQIDWDFINKPYETALKKSIQKNSESGLERIVRELDSSLGNTPEERVKNWWIWHCGEERIYNFKPKDFINEIRPFTRSSPTTITAHLEKHGYDLKYIFPRQRMEKNSNPTCLMKIDEDEWDAIVGSNQNENSKIIDLAI